VALREDIRRHYRLVAGRRLAWRERHAYYYRQLEGALRFVVRPGARVLELGCGVGDTLAALRPSLGVGVDLSPEMVAVARRRHPGLHFVVGDAQAPPLRGRFDYIVLSNLVGELEDVQECLEAVRPLCGPRTRLLIQGYSRLYQPVLHLAEGLGWKTPSPPGVNWLPPEEVENFLELAGFEPVYTWRHTLLPVGVPLLAELCNRWLAWLPLVRHLCWSYLVVARPLGMPRGEEPSLSVVMPCRNERGNLAAAVERLPVVGRFTELIFVEGGSSDGTAEEARRLVAEYRGPLRLRFLQQEGVGKADAVRKGFAHAGGEVLTILDADLTVPPEELPRFWRALVEDKGEFINGVRLVYPMEEEAMRFLNLLGNKFFGWVLSFLLRQRVRDTLCGTKMFWAEDWEGILAQREELAVDDPFGDFDLLFGAAKLGLRIRDLPVHYGQRTYGRTNISRFSHGWQLLRMCWVAFLRFAAPR